MDSGIEATESNSSARLGGRENDAVCKNETTSITFPVRRQLSHDPKIK